MEIISKYIKSQPLVAQIREHLKSSRAYHVRDTAPPVWERLALLPIDIALAVENEFFNTTSEPRDGPLLKSLVASKERALAEIHAKIGELEAGGILQMSDLDQPTLARLFMAPSYLALRALEALASEFGRPNYTPPISRSKFLDHHLKMLLEHRDVRRSTGPAGDERREGASTSSSSSSSSSATAPADESKATSGVVNPYAAESGAPGDRAKEDQRPPSSDRRPRGGPGFTLKPRDQNPASPRGAGPLPLRRGSQIFPNRGASGGSQVFPGRGRPGGAPVQAPSTRPADEKGGPAAPVDLAKLDEKIKELRGKGILAESEPNAGMMLDLRRAPTDVSIDALDALATAGSADKSQYVRTFIARRVLKDPAVLAAFQRLEDNGTACLHDFDTEAIISLSQLPEAQAVDSLNLYEERTRVSQPVTELNKSFLLKRLIRHKKAAAAAQTGAQPTVGAAPAPAPRPLAPPPYARATVRPSMPMLKHPLEKSMKRPRLDAPVAKPPPGVIPPYAAPAPPPSYAAATSGQPPAAPQPTAPGAASAPAPELDASIIERIDSMVAARLLRGPSDISAQARRVLANMKPELACKVLEELRSTLEKGPIRTVSTFLMKIVNRVTLSAGLDASPPTAAAAAQPEKPFVPLVSTAPSAVPPKPAPTAAFVKAPPSVAIVAPAVPMQAPLPAARSSSGVVLPVIVRAAQPGAPAAAPSSAPTPTGASPSPPPAGQVTPEQVHAYLEPLLHPDGLLIPDVLSALDRHFSNRWRALIRGESVIQFFTARNRDRYMVQQGRLLLAAGAPSAVPAPTILPPQQPPHPVPVPAPTPVQVNPYAPAPSYEPPPPPPPAPAAPNAFADQSYLAQIPTRAAPVVMAGPPANWMDELAHIVCNWLAESPRGVHVRDLQSRLQNLGPNWEFLNTGDTLTQFFRTNKSKFNLDENHEYIILAPAVAQQAMMAPTTAAVQPQQQPYANYSASYPPQQPQQPTEFMAAMGVEPAAKRARTDAYSTYMAGAAAAPAAPAMPVPPTAPTAQISPSDTRLGVMRYVLGESFNEVVGMIGLEGVVRIHDDGWTDRPLLVDAAAGNSAEFQELLRMLGVTQGGRRAQLRKLLSRK